MEEEDLNVDDTKLLADYAETWEKITEDLGNKGWNNKKLFDFIASFHASLIGFNIDVGNLNEEGATNLVDAFVDHVKKKVIRR